MMPVPRGPLPQDEYEAIYAKVPRLTVEVVTASTHGVLLTVREAGPCQGLWHIPGGTVRFGEPLAGAVQRVARQELNLEVTVGRLLGVIEYPSHLARGLDWPVGIAFLAEPAAPPAGGPLGKPGAAGWFSRLPDEMHDEQRDFLRAHGLAE
jgi:ADP-ribose pyrophosphatase YjhB (NUDIX family)